MQLLELRIDHLRNILAAKLEPDTHLNLIYGKNGSGKTTLLEAVYLIATAKSFRSQQHRHLVHHDHSELTLFARVNQQQQRHQIGIAKSSQGTRLHIDGDTVQSNAELARLFACQLINQNSFQLIDAGPKQRRRFMDWGLFHVEPTFYELWKRYFHILKQRNSLLKQNKQAIAFSAWNEQLSLVAQQIDGLRNTYIEQFMPIFNEIYPLLGAQAGVTIEYASGWDTDQSLKATLEADFQQDSRKGFTRSGPHRADIQIKLNRHAAEQALSRGQQKILVAALQLAQARHFYLHSKQHCVLLIDDLAAELDTDHQAAFMQVLSSIGGQVFMTATDADQAIMKHWDSKKVFHVEHGNVKEVI